MIFGQLALPRSYPHLASHYLKIYPPWNFLLLFRVRGDVWVWKLGYNAYCNKKRDTWA